LISIFNLIPACKISAAVWQPKVIPIFPDKKNGCRCSSFCFFLSFYKNNPSSLKLVTPTINTINMKTTKLFILVMATVCMAVANTVSVRAGLPSEERILPSFNGINIAMAGNVYLVQGPTQKLVVEGPERVVNDLITEVKNDRLTIRMPNRWRGRTDQLKIYITVPELNHLSLSGSARLLAESPINLKKLSISISGSGTIEIGDLSVSALSANISGSGRLKLGGHQNVENFGISISGSGQIDSRTLPVEQVKAAISGSGSCRVHALADLNVRISGSGRVIYSGNPLIDAVITGSGRVVNNN
jgi:hypothetical protein